MDGLTGEQIAALHDCFRNQRLGLSITYASSALFLFDYVLTIYDELRFVWAPRIRERNISLSYVAFFMARYPGLAITVLVLYYRDRVHAAVVSTSSVLKLVTIVASEFILAVRTWAIWERNRMILCVLVFFSVAAVVPATAIVAKDILTTELGPPIAPSLEDLVECRIYVSDIRIAYIVPYILTIIYEAVTLSFSLTRIIRWRRSIPDNIRTPLVDILWRDGILYYSWMLSLGFINIGIVFQSAIPQLRTGSSQLQMTLHSMLSTRIVLHLAAIGPTDRNSRDPSSALTDTRLKFQFTTNAGGLSMFDGGMQER